MGCVNGEDGLTIEAQAARPWLAIDAAEQGELGFALIQPGTRPLPGDVKRYPTSQFSTFTDGVLCFARDTGTSLRGIQLALAIAGAATGDVIPLARSRWTISRSGLAAMLGQQPVIINEVAAKAWATRDGLGKVTALRGPSIATLKRPGRYVFVGILDGIGAAIIDAAENGMRIIETEGGHMDFAATSAAEDELARACFPGTHPSWEQVVIMNPPASLIARIEPGALAVMRAGALGRMLGNMILASGAWDGVLVTGPRITALLEPRGARAAFDAAFSERQAFRRLIETAPVRRVEQPEAVIAGLSALVAERGP